MIYIPGLNDRVFLHAPISWEVSIAMLDIISQAYLTSTLHTVGHCVHRLAYFHSRRRGVEALQARVLSAVDEADCPLAVVV